MTSFITATKSGRFAFQRRVPSDLVNQISTPLVRILLPSQSRQEARQIGLILAGVVGAIFMSARAQPGLRIAKDAILKELSTAIADLKDVGVNDVSERLRALKRLQNAANIQEIGGLDDIHYRSAELDIQRTRTRLDALNASANNVKNVQRSLSNTSDKITMLIDEMLESQGAVPADGTAMDKLTAMLAELSASISKKHSFPPISDFIEGYIEKKTGELKKAEKGRDSNTVTYYIPMAYKAWIEIIGDMPIDEYAPLHMEEFVAVLSELPALRSKKKEMSGMGFRELIAWNKSLPADKKHKTLTADTILRGYQQNIKDLFKYACSRDAKNKLLSPFPSIEKSKTARDGEGRDAFRIDQINKIFRASSDEADDWKRWGPILAYFTGARIQDMVWLQRSDIKEVGDGLIIDMTDLLEDGTPRPGKNQFARRVIVVHPILEETGFIRWALQQKGHLFKSLLETKYPSATASKTGNRIIRGSSVKETNVSFHSFRHSFKKLGRKNKIPSRDLNLQCGHAPGETVAEDYGNKTLESDDFKQFWDMKLPEDLDLSGYLKC